MNARLRRAGAGGATAPAANWFLRRLDASVRRAPGRIAVVAAGLRLSYRDLDERVAVLAGLLRAAGLGRGARIGVHLENHAGFVSAWWAIWRVGGVAVPLSPRLRPAKWSRLVDDAGLAAVITQASLDAVWRADVIDGDGTSTELAAARMERRIERAEAGPDDILPGGGGVADGVAASPLGSAPDKVATVAALSDPGRGARGPQGGVHRGAHAGAYGGVRRGLRLLVVDDSGRLTAVLDQRPAAADPDRASIPCPTDDPAWAGADACDAPAGLAALLYTSGSTGVPKGVMHSHASMRAACRMVLPTLGLRADDVILCAQPLGFSYGLYQVLMAGVIGATLVLERGLSFPAQLLNVIERERVTVLPAVPTLIATLLGTRLPLARQLASVRVITTAGAPLPDAHLAALRTLCPQAAVHPMYGLTECKRVSILAADAGDAPAASVGRGLPGQSHWLLDEDGRVLPPRADQVGELVVAGPHLMLGYWRRPAETAAALRPGAAVGLPDATVLFTGDLFRERAGGWLEFVARRDDLIKCGGEKVSPREVEDALHRLAGVREALVLGIPDPIQGSRVQARIVRRADEVGGALDARAVIRHCLGLLEGPAVPRDVVFVDALPRTDSGKADRLSSASSIPGAVPSSPSVSQSPSSRSK